MAGPQVAATRDGRTVGIVAGSGRLPLLLCEHLAATGRHPFAVLIEEQADADFSPFDHRIRKLEDIAGIIRALREAGASQAVLAGGVDRRPLLRNLTVPLSFFTMLPTAAKALHAGDDVLLRIALEVLGRAGIEMVGAHEVMPDLLAPGGPFSAARPKPEHRAAIALAAIAARAIGALDIGQAAIAFGNRVVALEGIEGTAGLIERVGRMRAEGRIATSRPGVLVKCAKPQQDLRSDLPSIGVETVIAASEAGLSAIAVETDHSLVIDFRAVVEAADARGLILYGIAPGDHHG